MRILIFGKNGQIARHLNRAFHIKGKNYQVHFVGQDMVDLEKIEKLEIFLQGLHNIDVIINAAAFTDVDMAEIESNKALTINAVAVATIAKYASINHIKFIHYSTDYVFDGEKESYNEDDKPNPINYYGLTKLLGDLSIVHQPLKYMILRTSCVFSEFGNNFVKKILKSAHVPSTVENGLKVVNDQIGCPTYAGVIADATVQLLDMDVWNNIFNICSAPSISRYQFAKRIIDTAIKRGILPKIDVHPITFIESKKAHRPRSVILNTEKIRQIIDIPSWDIALDSINWILD